MIAGSPTFALAAGGQVSHMRVLHANNIHRGLGGISRTFADVVEILRGAGLEVDVFTRDSRDLPANLAGKLAAFAGGLYAARAVREFDAQLHDRRPDVVHVHELYPLISPWILPRCAAAGIPVVMSSYDYRLSCPVSTHHTRGAECLRCLGGREYWCVLRNCRASVPESVAYAMRTASARHFGLYERHVARYTACSAHGRDYLTGRLGIDASRVVVNFPPIRLPAQPVEDAAAGGYVAFAGRFVPEKGVEVLVEACRRARLPVRFAGDAPRHPAVRPGDDAVFVMTRSREELAAFYRGARVLAVPSLWPETFGVVAAEAMSHGVPVVASRIGALPETVRDGETGLLARPGDAADLAEKLAAIWSDAPFARRLGRNAREHARAFDERTHAACLVRLYEGLAAGQNSRIDGESSWAATADSRKGM